MHFTSEADLEQVCWTLQQRHPHENADFAFLIANETVYYAVLVRAAKTLKPESATTVLIQGIYQHFQAEALRILRNRIFCSSAPSEMCLGMIKVAAKRGGSVVAPKNHALVVPFEFCQIFFDNLIFVQAPHPSEFAEPHEVFQIARKLALQMETHDELFLNDRAVAAVLLSEKGELLAEARNTNALNKTLHAEVNLLQGYFKLSGNKFPKNAKIYTTLKPCKMCAGMISVYAFGQENLRVIYEIYDSGPNARSTVLNKGSAEWDRAFKNKPPPTAQMEYALEEWLNHENKQ